MKAWRNTTRQSQNIQRRTRLENKLQVKIISDPKQPRRPVQEILNPPRPGTVLRHQIKKFQKNTRQRLEHVGKYSTDGAHKSSMDKREARRIGREALSNVELFKGLPLTKLAEKLRFTAFRTGDPLIEQNVVGNLLYIILEGQVAIYIDKQQLAVKDVGTLLGERSMIFDQRTTATCIARSPVRCAFLTRNAFLESIPDGALPKLIQHCRLQDTLSNRGTRSYDHLDESMQLAVFKRIQDLSKRLIRDRDNRIRIRKENQIKLQRHWQVSRSHGMYIIICLLPSFKHLSETTKINLSKMMVMKSIKKGDVLYSRKRKPKGCYWILKGSFQLRTKMRSQGRLHEGSVRTAIRHENMGNYEMFSTLFRSTTSTGIDLNINESILRTCTARARRDSIVLCLPIKYAKAVYVMCAKELQRHIQRQGNEQIRVLVESAAKFCICSRLQILNLHPTIRKFQHNEFSLLAEGTISHIRQFGPGSTISKKDSTCESILFVIQGECLMMSSTKSSQEGSSTGSTGSSGSSGLATLGPGSMYGANDLFHNGNIERIKSLSRYQTSLVAGSKGAVVIEINQVHIFSLLSGSTLQIIANDANVSAAWRQKRLYDGLNQTPLSPPIQRNNGDHMQWKQPLGERPTVPFGRLLMSHLIRPEIGLSKGVPSRLKVSGVVPSVNTSIDVTAASLPAIETLQISTARLGREKKVPQIQRIPRVSGGRIADDKTLATLAKDVWNIQVIDKPQDYGSTHHPLSSTILLPRESVRQQPAVRPKKSIHQHGHVTKTSMQLVPTRPLTKRANYELVHFYGPRCSVSKKWKMELRPSTQMQRYVPKMLISTSRPKPPLLSSELSKVPSLSNFIGQPMPLRSRVEEEETDTFLDVNKWPATFSRAGKRDRRSRKKKKRTKKKKQYFQSSTQAMPSMNQNVGGTLVRIGSTFLPSISRRMR